MSNSKQVNQNEIASAFVAQARRLLCEEYLPRIERCLEQLSDSQIWWRANQESNSIGNLLLHLAGNTRQWIVSGLGGEADRRLRHQEFSQLEGIERAELLKRLSNAVSEAEKVLEQLDLSQLLERRQIQGTQVTVLEAIFHVTEHFSAHTGQIIFLTKLLTGRDLHFYEFKEGVPVRRWHPHND